MERKRLWNSICYALSAIMLVYLAFSYSSARADETVVIDQTIAVGATCAATNRMAEDHEAAKKWYEFLVGFSGWEDAKADGLVTGIVDAIRRKMETGEINTDMFYEGKQACDDSWIGLMKLLEDAASHEAADS